MSDNLFEIFQSHAPADRSAEFLRTGGGRRLTYQDTDEMSGRFAQLFCGLGLRKGDRIAVQVEKSPEALMIYLAALRSGTVLLPLNTAYTASELAYFLGDAEPGLLICDPRRLETLQPIAALCGVPHVLTLNGEGEGTLVDESQSLAPDFGCVPAAADDLAAILYTSGTTGRSKGAMLSHENLSSNTLTLRDYWGFTSKDVLLHALPIFHTHGLFVATNCVLLSGARMIFLPKFDAEEVISLLPKATSMMGVPTFYTRLLANPNFTVETCKTVRLFISGSAPLLEETFNAFHERTGQKILERYGMTETTMSTSNPLKGERKAGTVGHALPGVSYKIADDTGKSLPDGEIGVLEVKGPNVFKGYWRNPEKTAEEFRPDGYFITGDMAQVGADGYLRIVGRSKDLIISGGFNVYPKEIETHIDQIEGVTETAVIGLPHPDFGEAVCAVVKRDPSGAPITEDKIISASKDALANFKVPKRVFFVDDLPRNAMGKVQKNALREEYKDTFAPVA